ncbi:MAG: hypothetical protein PHW13_04440 [Methylococcales bacterium]|nr:hypothetical protein [Methylococcales bacterium]
MANRSTHAQVKRKGGDHLTIQQQETDSPVLPVAQLEQLQAFKPDAVDWIINQTRIEAEHRRKMDNRINLFTFIEHMLGQLFAFLIGIAGVIGGVYASVNGQPTAGGAIAAAALTGLAVVFLTGRSN